MCEYLYNQLYKREYVCRKRSEIAPFLVENKENKEETIFDCFQVQVGSQLQIKQPTDFEDKKHFFQTILGGNNVSKFTTLLEKTRASECLVASITVGNYPFLLFSIFQKSIIN